MRFVSLERVEKNILLLFYVLSICEKKRNVKTDANTSNLKY